MGSDHGITPSETADELLHDEQNTIGVKDTESSRELPWRCQVVVYYPVGHSISGTQLVL